MARQDQGICTTAPADAIYHRPGFKHLADRNLSRIVEYRDSRLVRGAINAKHRTRRVGWQSGPKRQHLSMTVNNTRNADQFVVPTKRPNALKTLSRIRIDIIGISLIEESLLNTAKLKIDHSTEK